MQGQINPEIIPEVKRGGIDTFYDSGSNKISLTRPMVASYDRVQNEQALVQAYCVVRIGLANSAVFQITRARSVKETCDGDNIYLFISEDTYNELLKQKLISPIQSSGFYYSQANVLNPILQHLFARNENVDVQNIETQANSAFWHEIMHFVSTKILFHGALDSCNEIMTKLRKSPDFKKYPTPPLPGQLKLDFHLIKSLCEAYSMLHEMAGTRAVINNGSRINPDLLDNKLIHMLEIAKMDGTISFGSFFINPSVTTQYIDAHLIGLIMLLNSDFFSPKSGKLFREWKSNQEIDGIIARGLEEYAKDPEAFLLNMDLERLKKILEIKLFDCLEAFSRDYAEYVSNLDENTTREELETELQGLKEALETSKGVIDISRSDITGWSNYAP